MSGTARSAPKRKPRNGTIVCRQARKRGEYGHALVSRRSWVRFVGGRFGSETLLATAATACVI
jgi:hypothetical protein